MAGPITWRNVTGFDPALASRPLAQAQDSFNDSFGILNKLIQQREATDASNVVTQQENQKNAYLNLLSSAKDPAALAQLQQSGALDQAFQALPPAMQAQVRDAREQRLSTVQDLFTKNRAFAKEEQDARDEPGVLEFQRLLAAGDAAGAKANLEANQYRNEAPLYEALNKAEQDEIQRARGNLRFGEEVTGWGRAAESHADSIATNAARRGLIGIQGQNAQLELTERKQTAEDRAADRNVQKLAATAQAEYRQRQFQARQGLGQLAKAHGMPLDSTGAPDYDNLTTDQIGQLDALAVANGLPKTSEVFGGDTRQAQSFYQSLFGKVPAEVLARNQQKVFAGFDTTGTTASMGNDAYLATLERARQDTLQEELDANNWMLPGTGQSQALLEKIVPNIGGMIDKHSGNDPEEDIGAMVTAVTDVAQNGIPVNVDSKTVKIVPPAAWIEAEIRAAKGGILNDDARAKNFLKNLTLRMQAANTKEMMAQMEESKHAKRNRDVRKKLKENLLQK